MEAYAIVETGGKQYMVRPGNTLDVELLAVEKGQTARLDRVLAVSDGTTLTVGTPTVSGAAVTVEVLDQIRGPKLVSFKKKRRKGYHRKVGHRQELTRVRIKEIAAG